jgi:hypothetical protein
MASSAFRNSFGDIVHVLLGQLGQIFLNCQILDILFLGRLREIEAPGDYSGTVNDQNLGVGDGGFVVDVDRDASIEEEFGRGILRI